MAKRGAGQPRWYAVCVGRTPGVFASWGACSASVTGFPGALHRSFSTEGEAQAFLSCDGLPAATAASSVDGAASLQGGLEAAPRDESKAPLLSDPSLSSVPLLRVSTRPNPFAPPSISHLASVLSKRPPPSPTSDAAAPCTHDAVGEPPNGDHPLARAPALEPLLSSPLAADQSAAGALSLGSAIKAPPPPMTTTTTTRTAAAGAASSAKKKARPSKGVAQAAMPTAVKAAEPSQKVKKVHPFVIAKENMQPPAQYIVYTDGSCPHNGQPGAVAGYGVFWLHDLALCRSGALNADDEQTNNRAELTAVLEALRVAATMPGILEVRTDSMYVLNSLALWSVRWLASDWKDPPKPKNTELVKEILALAQQRAEPVRISHVRGHQGDYGNEVADRLANHGVSLSARLSQRADAPPLSPASAADAHQEAIMRILLRLQDQHPALREILERASSLDATAQKRLALDEREEAHRVLSRLVPVIVQRLCAFVNVSNVSNAGNAAHSPGRATGSREASPTEVAARKREAAVALEELAKAISVLAPLADPVACIEAALANYAAHVGAARPDPTPCGWAAPASPPGDGTAEFFPRKEAHLLPQQGAVAAAQAAQVLDGPTSASPQSPRTVTTTTTTVASASSASATPTIVTTTTTTTMTTTGG